MKGLLSCVLSIGFALSIVGCGFLSDGDDIFGSKTEINIPVEDVDSDSDLYTGNKTDKVDYSGITYLQEEFDYSAIYEENYKSVITITVNSSVGGGFFGKPTQNTAIGSGFIISEDGFVLTSLSLLPTRGTLTKIEGTLYNGESFEISSASEDIISAVNCDMMLLKFSEEVFYENEQGTRVSGMPDVVEFGNSDDLEYGENCAYIATISDDDDYFLGVAEGIVSKPKNTDDDFATYLDGYNEYKDKITCDYLIQTSITSNDGNEGGALFNADGKVVGLITTEAEKTLTYQQHGGYGMSFSVPSTTIHEFIEAVQDTYPDLSIELPESVNTNQNYIENSDSGLISTEFNAIYQRFKNSSGTEIANKNQTVILNYQGDRQKTGSTAAYIADNLQNFTVNVYAADKNGEHISSGSGFIISEDGYVLTNLHVVNAMVKNSEGNANEQVELYPYVFCSFENGTLQSKKISFVMEIVAYDKVQDIAVLKFVNDFQHRNAQGALCNGFEKVCKFAAYSDLKTGEKVVAIGNALGYGSSVTDGVVTQIAMTYYQEIYGHSFIQTDCPINSGNSGGALFNARGLVVGINSMGAPSYENVSWAMPSDSVTQFIKIVKSKKSTESVKIVNTNLAANISFQQ